MADGGIEHQTQIRRTRRSPTAFLALVGTIVLAVAVLLLLWGSDGDDRRGEATPEPTSTSTPPTTPPTRLPVVHVIADTDDGPQPATTATGPGTGPGDRFEAVQATPVLTDGRIAVLVDGGTVLAGAPGDAFHRVGPDAPSSALVASNEPGHVWVVGPGDELSLVSLDGIPNRVRIPLDGHRVLGPAAFGVVTVGSDGAVAWRRPSFDPSPVPLPTGRTAVDAGGEVVLAERSLGAEVGRGFELIAVDDGAVVQDFLVGPSDRAPALAPDGSVVALPGGFGWTVRDVSSRAELGSLPRAPGMPVWIGEGRFAVLVDGAIVLSDGRQLAPPWPVRDLAEHSP